MERSEDVLLSSGGMNSNGDVNAVLNTNSTSSSSSNNTQPNNASDRTNNSYSMPGILHFLQHEWNRFEFERQQWELDRAELMTKISFLQGERRGQENLKNNLLRRIKMLEIALKQERIKYHKLKFGADLPLFNNTQNETKNNTSLSNDNDENETSTFSISQHPILNKENSTNTNAIKQGRQLLKQYLQEIGCADTIIDVRSARLRSLLGRANQVEQTMDLLTQANQLDPLSSIINGNKQLLQLSINSNNKRVSTNKTNGGLNTNDVQKILKLSENETNQKDQNIISLSGVTNDQTNSGAFYDDDEEMGEEDVNKNSHDSDLDTEDALKEFAFLSSESSSDMDSSSDWNVDKAHITKLTEQYKKDRKSAKNAKIEAQHSMVNTHRPNRSALQAMIVNLTEQSNEIQNDSSINIQSNVSIIGNNKSPSSMDSSPNPKNDKIKFNTPNNLFSLEDDNFSNETNLGELSRISVGNNMNMTGISDETIIDSSRKTITNKHTLRGHFDSVRCLAFHNNESVLLSGSEDHTIKLWNLDKSTINNKKNSNTDIEPLYTFRKHVGAVLSLLITPSGDHAISSGLDSKIIVWNMPNYDTVDQYDPYNPNVFVKNLKGHTDAVWNLSLVDNTLVSVSADSSIRVWNPFSIDELDDASSSFLSCLNEDKSEGVPTSIDFINNENTRIITSFGQSHHILYDLETSKSISRFDFFDSSSNTYCYRVISQPSSSLIVSAHEDKRIRFFDINSGKMVYQMVAHQDACTDIAIDPTCNYLLSSSHDCSIRLWNLENKNCIQEMTSHRKKYDESINCVAFHATKPFIASGGADAIIKIYV